MEYLDDWQATEDHQPVGPPKITVTGSVRFTEGGWSADLRAHDGSAPFNPRVLMLDLVVTEPDDPLRTRVIEEKPVRYEDSVSDETECQYDKVHVRAVGVDAPDNIVNVDCVSRQT